MNNMKNIIKSVGLAAVVGITVTSCDLDMLPLNEVVLENYWTDKNDVENVLRSCYVGMQENGWVGKAIVWGEVRSDNVITGPSAGTDLQYLIKGNLKQNNSYCDWAAFYNVINRCNIVLYYAPRVKDPNISPSDSLAYIAEAKAIRALNYFYLVRTFKDVPFVIEPSIDDTQEFKVPASKGEDIIDALLADLESCKDYAPRKYATGSKKNSGRITRSAIYTLLADMYLWRASDANLDAARQQAYYRKCVECCDEVIDFKINQYVQDEDNSLNRKVDAFIYQTYGYPLLKETDEANSDDQSPAAYNQIFGEGNSFESIFELTYGTANSDVKNTDVSYMYGGTPQSSSTPTRYVTASPNIMSESPGTNKTYNNDKLFSVTSDFRSLSSFRFVEAATSNSGYNILKYIRRSVMSSEFGKVGSSWALPTGNAGTDSRSYESSYEGWIIYRLTDVMLMRAEAELELGHYLAETADIEEPEDGEEAASAKTRAAELTTASDYYTDAFKLIMAVYLRSNPYAQTINTASAPQATNFTSYANLVKLLDNERRREFLFEGKRYFDLVRKARRIGNTSELSTAIVTKFDEASRAFLIKMAMMDFMYMPYAKRQLDVNPYLKQNPVYSEEDDYVKS